MKSEKNKYCCELMQDLLDEARVAINYNAKYREYSIDLRENKIVRQGIFHCPWCGNKLPRRLRDDYFEALKAEHNMDIDIMRKDSELPSDFRDETWWRKRGL